MKPLTILLAEDSPSTGQFISTYLKDNGHNVIWVQSGEAAIEAYQQATPDLVLMDVVMPGIGGLEAARRIKAMQVNRWVPLIIITARDDEGDILDGYMAGADDYLIKPLRPLVLDIRMRTMVRIASLQRATDAVIASIADAVIRIDRIGRITLFNKAAETMFGYNEQEALGENVNVLMPSPHREAHDDYIAHYVATGERKVLGVGRKLVAQRRNGELFPIHLSVSEAATPEGTFYVGLIRDLSVEERLRREVEFLAMHDALTRLPNRAQCWQHLDERYAIKAQGRGPADCAVLFCDLDGFKQINDSHGHAIGDIVLQEAARRLREALFVRDFLARIGGDEFVAIVDGARDEARLGELAQRIVAAVAAPITTAVGDLTLGVSIGIAHSRDYPESVATLINAADTAMYRAKREGKGRHAIARPD